MINIVSIVEGDGEVAALPVLLRRLAHEWEPAVAAYPLPPIRVRRDKFIQREDEFRRQLLLASAKSGDDGWILILLDADDDCPAELGRSLLARARQLVPHRRVSVVLANREFEAWFIAAARSLDGLRGFAAMPHDHQERAEVPRNAKGWIRERMQSGTYSEMLDQPAFTATMSLQQAFENSRSFRKLCSEWKINVSQRVRGMNAGA